MYKEELVKTTNENRDLIFVSIFLWIAAFVATLIPVFAIPFAFAAIARSFVIKSKLCEVASVIVACYVIISIFYWIISVYQMM